MATEIRNPATGQLEEVLGWNTAGQPVFHGNGGYNLRCRCGVCRDGATRAAYEALGWEIPEPDGDVTVAQAMAVGDVLNRMLGGR